MPEFSFREEFAVLAKRAVLLDIAAYCMSIPFYGMTISFAAGLAAGTLVLFGSLFLLNLSLARMAEEAKRSGTSSQKRFLLFYGLRLGLFALAFGAALLSRGRVSPVGTALPVFYPRLVYTAQAMFRKKKSHRGRKEYDSGKKR